MAPCNCCSNRVLPQPGPGDKEKPPLPRLARVNGWSLPLHWSQVVAWLIFLLITTSCFGVFIPLLPENWRLVAYCVAGGIFLLVYFTSLATASIDLAETHVQLWDYKKPLLVFDRSKHPHVIENWYCHLCQVPVTEKAKHCGTCNKCIAGFDHHCQWLNNYVGRRNYWCFVCTMVSALAALLFVISIVVYIFVKHSTDPKSLCTDYHYKEVFGEDTWLLLLPVFTAVVVSLGVGMLRLSLVVVLVLGQLLFFHIYLSMCLPSLSTPI